MLCVPEASYCCRDVRENSSSSFWCLQNNTDVEVQLKMGGISNELMTVAASQKYLFLKVVFSYAFQSSVMYLAKFSYFFFF